MILPTSSCAWVCRQGNRVTDFVVAKSLFALGSWEITHLFLDPREHNRLPELLDKLSQTAASRGGERIFLRLQRDDPLVNVTRLSGFFPCIPEALYIRAGRHVGETEIYSYPSSGPVLLRTKREADEYNLFQLYNATTPPEVRKGVGMTFGQWMASRGRIQNRSIELVLEKNGVIRGWLRAYQRSSTGQLAILIHPDDEGELAHFVDFGLAQLPQPRTIFCLVPFSHISLQHALKFRGFEVKSDFVTLIKATAITANEETRFQKAMPFA